MTFPTQVVNEEADAFSWCYHAALELRSRLKYLAHHIRC